MDNQLVKTIGTYVVAALVGGGIGYVIADRVVKASRDEGYYQKEYNERMGYWERGGVAVPAPGEASTDEELIAQGMSRDPDGTIREGFVVTDEKSSKRPKAKIKPVDYAGIMKKPLSEVAKERLGEEGEPVDRSLPYVITLDQYNQSAEAGVIEQVAYIYYEEDDVLVSAEDEVPVSDQELGDALSQFGKGSEDPDIVYVRDEVHHRDVEISRVHNSYNEVVLGKPKKEPKKGKTRKVRKVDVDTSEGEEQEQE
jgi:hypothetical protein